MQVFPVGSRNAAGPSQLRESFSFPLAGTLAVSQPCTSSVEDCAGSSVGKEQPHRSREIIFAIMLPGREN